MTGFRLMNSVLESLTGVTLEECAVACLEYEDRLCFSVNYQPDSGSCELNQGNTAPAAVTGWDYVTLTSFGAGVGLQSGAFLGFGFNSLLRNINRVDVEFKTNTANGLLWRQGQTSSLIGDFFGAQFVNGT